MSIREVLRRNCELLMEARRIPSQRHLSSLSGVSEKTVHNVMSNYEISPSIDTLESIANALDVELSTLLDRQLTWPRLQLADHEMSLRKLQALPGEKRRYIEDLVERFS